MIDVTHKLFKWLLFISVFILSGCAGATGNISSENPIEKGLSYVAAAIVTHAVMQCLFRK